MKYGIVNVAIAALMEKPTKESELVDEALYGMQVEVLNKENENWYLIKTNYRYKGYVHASELLLDEGKVLAWDQGDKSVILQAYIDIISIPKIQGVKVISLTKGGLLSVIKPADSQGWVKVSLCDGREGYVKDKYIGEYIINYSLEDEEKLRQRLVETALSYMGTQYRWGGKSTLGIDCSGLCAMAYMLNGILIFRDSRIAEGFPIHEIDFEDKKPGDLIYYKGHVVMYLEDDKVLNSTNENGYDGVVINSYNPEDEDYRAALSKENIKATGSLF